MENIVFNLYANVNDDRLWNKKALVHWKSQEQAQEQEQQQRW